MKAILTLSSLAYGSAGPSYSVPNLCRGLELAGVDAVLYTRQSRIQGEPPCKTKFFKLPPRYNPRLGNAPELYRGLCGGAKDADILHANGLWMVPCLYPGWVRRRSKVKLVWSPRGAMAAWTFKKSWLRKKIFWWLFQRRAVAQTDLFHATSEKEYGEIRALGFKQPVAIIPIGMDIPSVERPPMGARRKIVFFGRLHAVKKVDDLLLAWEKVQAELPDWEVEIAGPDFGARQALKELVASHQIPRVKFVGEIKGSAKYEFLASADLYVLPSLTENFGITIAEALACGTPVIASRGTPWGGLEGNKCGWWVENSPEAIAKAILEAAALPRTELMQMGQCGVKWIERDFSWAGIGQKMNSAYEWLLRGGVKPEWVRED